MCYKEELQKKNGEKLQEIFKRDGAPEFIQRLFKTFGRSKATSITYWGVIRDLLQYMIDNSIIHKEKIEDIEPDDMLEIESPEIQGYLEYKELNGIRHWYATMFSKNDIIEKIIKNRNERLILLCNNCK